MNFRNCSSAAEEVLSLPHLLVFFFCSLGINLLLKKYKLCYLWHFYVDSTNEIGTKYVFLQETASDKGYNLKLALCYVVCYIQTQHGFFLELDAFYASVTLKSVLNS